MGQSLAKGRDKPPGIVIALAGIRQPPEKFCGSKLSRPGQYVLIRAVDLRRPSRNRYAESMLWIVQRALPIADAICPTTSANTLSPGAKVTVRLT